MEELNLEILTAALATGIFASLLLNRATQYAYVKRAYWAMANGVSMLGDGQLAFPLEGNLNFRLAYFESLKNLY